ncbi:MAG: PIN/TRAM domain-containing protein [Planctomycetaceae bacterium]|jgi:uncharacterized protein YacL|nr:PIN/TRAM domain-containing protein [Planctomycetaceae bacterium]
MLLIVLRCLYFIVCAGATATFVSQGAPRIEIGPLVIGNELVLFGIFMLLSQVVTIVDILLPRKRIEVISSIYFGLLVGVLLSYLLIQALSPVIEGSPHRNTVVMLTALILPYFCISLLLQTKDDFRFVIPYIEFVRELKGGRPMVIDSSALIDGRISDMAETNILDTQLVVPQFVLQEVQDIADSRDKNRRSRGRRGLDMLSKLQNNPKMDVRMHEARKSDYKGLPVDQCLVALAKQLGGRIMTNDFNLNKVAGVQGIDVVNLNDIANALKPRYLPGERLHIKILKEGESQGQGVGYLDDGTMVVCEQTSHLVGNDIDVIVTSVLQSSAGRMMFGRQVNNSDRS